MLISSKKTLRIDNELRKLHLPSVCLVQIAKQRDAAANIRINYASTANIRKGKEL